MAPHDFEEALRRSEAFAARLIESSRDCIEVLDLKGHLLAMNAHGMTAREICDFGPLLGSTWIEFWDGQDREHARAGVEEARQGRVGRFTGFFATTQTKMPKWWDVSVTAILDQDGKPERLLAISRDVTGLKQAEQAIQQAHDQLEQQVAARTHELAQTGAVLQQIVEGVESKIGEQFFPALVQHLATALGVDYAYVSERSEDGDRFRSRAGWGKGQPLPQFDVPARGPCESVLRRKCVHHPEQLRVLFPHVQLIQDLGVESYCGAPILDSSARVLGHLAILDSKSMPDRLRASSVLGIFAIRAAAEFERLRFERALG